MKMEVTFRGNGDATDNIRRAVERLVEDLNEIGKADRSKWNMSIGGAGGELVAEGEQIVNDAKSILSLIKGYVGHWK